MVAQWDPKASKMALNEPPKLPKWTPELTKWEFGDAKNSQNGPQNCQNEALKDPKVSKSTQAKMTKLTLNRKH